MTPRAAFRRAFPVKRILGRAATEAKARWTARPWWQRGLIATAIAFAALPWLFRAAWWMWARYAAYFDWAAGLARGTALERLTPVVR